MKKYLTDIFERFGYQIIPTWRKPALALATLTRDLLQYYEINLALDVGANSGQYRDFLRQEVGYQGDIISFEPQPDLVELLDRRSNIDPKWKVHHLALGSAATDLELNIMYRGQFSSFLEPDNTNQPQFADLNRIQETMKVEVKRLDSFLFTQAKNVFLKSDTQGFDMEVIRGASDILENIAIIQMEMSMQPIYKGMPKYLDSIAELGALGYIPAGFFAVSRSKNLAAIEMDCLLVRKPKCDPKA